MSIQDQPAGESQATTPQSAAVEDGTGDSKGIENNRPFPSCFEPHYESEAKCKVFHMKIGFVCI